MPAPTFYTSRVKRRISNIITLSLERPRETCNLLAPSFSSSISTAYFKPYILLYEEISMPLFSHEDIASFIIPSIMKSKMKIWEETTLMEASHGELKWNIAAHRIHTFQRWTEFLSYSSVRGSVTDSYGRPNRMLFSDQEGQGLWVFGRCQFTNTSRGGNAICKTPTELETGCSRIVYN